MATRSKVEQYREILRIENKKARQHMAYFANAVLPEYELEWFHLLVYDLLNKWVNKEIQKLCIFMPPQHGKSTMSSIVNPAYILGLKPDAKVVCASYAQEIASKFNRRSQDIIDTQRYLDIFPNTKMPGKVNGRTNELRNSRYFEILHSKGFYRSVGVEGGLTSETVEYGIIDDPIKDRLQANSPTYRNRLWDWYMDVWSTRLNNESCELLLFTRWHEDDLAGRLFDPNNEHYDEERAKKYTVFILPAVKEDAAPPIAQAVPINDPRRTGQALWESMHSIEKHLEDKRTNPYMFASLKQQRPSPLEGGLLKKEWFQIIKANQLPFDPDSETHPVPVHAMIDGAYTDKTENDPSAIITYWVHEGNLYIKHCTSVRLDLSRFLPFANTYLKQQAVSSLSNVRIEFKASGPGMISMLRQEQYGGWNCSRVNSVHVSWGKYTRGEMATPALASGKVFILQGSWNEAFLKQCVTFPNDVHDDMYDLLCYAILQEVHKVGRRIRKSSAKLVPSKN